MANVKSMSMDVLGGVLKEGIIAEARRIAATAIEEAIREAVVKAEGDIAKSLDELFKGIAIELVANYMPELMSTTLNVVVTRDPRDSTSPQ